MKFKLMNRLNDMKIIPPPLIKLEDSMLLKSLNAELSKIINEMKAKNVYSFEIDFRRLFTHHFEENLDIELKYFRRFLIAFITSSKKFLTIILSNENEFLENCENDLYIFNYKNYKGTRNYNIILQEIKYLGNFIVNENDVNAIDVLKYLLSLNEKIDMIMKNDKNSFNDKLSKDILLEYIKYDNYNDFSNEFDKELDNISINNTTLFSLIFTLRDYEGKFQKFIIKNIIWSNLQEFIKIKDSFNDITKTFKINQDYVDQFYHSMKNKQKIIKYISNLCDELNEIFQKDLKRNVKLLIKSFEKDKKINFNDYYENVLVKLTKYNILDAFNNISLNLKLFLVFTFYFKINVNTFKDHIFNKYILNKYKI